MKEQSTANKKVKGILRELYAIGYSYDNIRVLLDVVFGYIHSVNKKVNKTQDEFNRLFDILIKGNESEDK